MKDVFPTKECPRLNSTLGGPSRPSTTVFKVTLLVSGSDEDTGHGTRDTGRGEDETGEGTREPGALTVLSRTLVTRGYSGP